MATASVSDLAARFSGRLLQPTDAGYDDARRVHNGLIDKRPRSSPSPATAPTSPTRSSSRTTADSKWRSKAAATTSPAGARSTPA